jgi:DNA polymerase III subunit delta'
LSEALADEPDRLPGAPHPRETLRLFGQAAAEDDYLAALAAGRAPHGWLVTGPRGTGKATLAWRMARHLLVGDPAAPLDLDPAHPVIRATKALAHPGLCLVRRPWDAKAERLRAEITVDEVRGLAGFFRLSATEGGARVAIIDAADEMNVSAANALLKLLEEPPAGGHLILVSHRPGRLLPTIRSRCRELRCRPLGAEDLAAALAGAGVEAAGDAAVLAELAGGSVGAAIRLAAEGGLTLYDEICGLIAGAPPVDRPRAIALAESAAGRGAEARYEAILALADLALSRLARAAAGAAVRPSGEAEARAQARLAAGPAQARLWAETAARVAARAGHARAVRLDPAQVILDMVLQIDAAAGEAASLPA